MVRAKSANAQSLASSTASTNASTINRVTDTSVSASRNALCNVSNRQTNVAGGSSAPNDFHCTKTIDGSRSHRIQPWSAKHPGRSVPRHFSKSHGDLSKLRPKSPPLSWTIGATNGLQFSPIGSEDNTLDAFAPNHNRHSRQSRQVIPSDWLPEQPLHMTNVARSKESPDRFPPPPSSSSTGCQNRNQKGTTLLDSQLSLPEYVSSTRDLDFRHRQPEVPPFEIPPSASAQSTSGQYPDYARLGPASIQGLGPDILGPLDFCIPINRRYPAGDDQSQNTGLGFPDGCPSVQHVDVTTTWIGLRYMEAQELYRIHQAFTVTLQNLLKAEIWKIYQQRDNLAAINSNEDLYSTGVVRGIGFCRDQLVGEMADWLYSSNEDMARAQLGLLRLYLAASDCLVPYEQHPRDTSITIRVCGLRRLPLSSPIVTAGWVPDRIALTCTNGILREGHEFSLIPQYLSKSTFGSTRPPSNIAWSMSSQGASLSWLKWCDELAGFKGIVPALPNLWRHNGHTGNPFNGDQNCQRLSYCIEKLCINIKAVLMDDNGSRVCFERVVRARFTLGFLPGSVWDDSLVAGHNQYAGFEASVTPMVHECTAQNLPTPMKPAHTHSYRPKIGETLLKSFDQGQSDPRSLIRKSAVTTTRVSDCAQNYPFGGASCADMTQGCADVETQVRMLESLSIPGSAAGHQGYSSISPPGLRHNLQLGNPFYEERVAASTERPAGAPYFADRKAVPCSPQLEARRQASSFDQGENATFPSLPSPAIHLFPSQTFDEEVQAWNRTKTPERTCDSQDPMLFHCGTKASHFSQNLLPSTEKEMLKVEAEDLYGSPVRQTYSQDFMTASQTPQTAPTGQSIEFACKAAQETHKLHAKLRPNTTSPITLLKESDKGGDDATLLLERQAARTSCSTCESRAPNAQRAGHGREVKIRVRESVEHLCQPQNRHLASTAPDNPLSSNQAQTSRNPFESPPTPTTPLPACHRADAAEQNRPLPLVQETDPKFRNISIQSYQSADTCSSAPSSSIGLLIEDLQVALHRTEQARTWAQSLGADDSDKENRPQISVNKPKLSDEETLALSDALKRSHLEMTGDLSSVFLDDSDSSTTDDGEVDE